MSLNTHSFDKSRDSTQFHFLAAIASYLQTQKANEKGLNAQWKRSAQNNKNCKRKFVKLVQYKETKEEKKVSKYLLHSILYCIQWKGSVHTDEKKSIVVV